LINLKTFGATFGIGGAVAPSFPSGYAPACNVSCKVFCKALDSTVQFKYSAFHQHYDEHNDSVACHWSLHLPAPGCRNHSSRFSSFAVLPL